MKSRAYSWVYAIILTTLIVTACGSTNSPRNNPINNNENGVSVVENNVNSSNNNQNNAPSIENNIAIVENDAPQTTTDEDPGLPALPPEPQSIDLLIPDGRVLEGLYYPAAVNPAPTIILLHMAGASQKDWQTIAPWLQNRDQPLPEGNRTWFDASWFPALPEDVSFGVFVFTFGGFSGSPGGDWRDFPLEALTAIQTVSMLEGVDPNQISTMGTSIGADSSASSCYQFNLFVSQGNGEGSCLGSFSLSPGNYLLGGDHLSETYQEIVVGQQTFSFPVTIYCLASENDSNSPATCLGAQQDTVANYFPYIFSGRAHGMYLIKEDTFPAQPESDKNTLGLYLQFLDTVYELDINP